MAGADRIAAAIDAVAERHVGTSEAAPPGAVIHVRRGGTLVHERACGLARRADAGVAPRPTRTDTVFDLGSITKIVATTAAIMALVDRGALDLDAPLSSWLDRWSGGGREAVTVRHLLEHRGGLWEWWPVYFHARERDAAIRFVCSHALRYPVDSRRAYSDLGFMLLGEIVRRAAGEELDAAAQRLVLGPLGLQDTRYRPAAGIAERIAATSRGDSYEREMVATGRPYPVAVDPGAFTDWREATLVGEVNDGNAHHAFGGVAGHAGLFSTARDLAVFGEALAADGAHGSTRVWQPDTVARFTRDQRDRGQGLGFWTRRLSGTEDADPAAFGHGGFPGTEIAISPATGLVVVLLTNRLHCPGAAWPLEAMWRDLLGAVAGSPRPGRR
jgi:CubicO group peptidase (beta-lactamase class C family)